MATNLEPRMDMMGMAMGNFLPILTQPVKFHGGRDPGACTMTAEQCAYKWRYWVFWYNADHVYGLSSIYFFIATIGVFAITSLANRYAPASITRNLTWQRLSAVFRTFSYRKVKFLGWTAPSVGITILGAVGAIFFLLITFLPQPYYWPNTLHPALSYGNSPPLATRTGWLALGCLPFVFALGSKASPITKLTGIPHEKLNVFHNWAAWAMLILALIHTFPFIVFHQWKGDLMTEFTDGGVWLTGIIALLAQAWLTLMSFSRIRNRYYEFFKTTHLFFAAVFFVFFFLHCNFSLTSWDYFVAAGLLYAASLVYAWAKTFLVHGVHRASLMLETGRTLKISVPTKSSWSPGQHLFLRFLTPDVHAVTAHPFTICSVPAVNNGEKSALVFYVEPRGGATAELQRLAADQPGVTVPVLLEGPYGGLGARWAKGFDKTLVVAGGAGACFSLALIEDWIRDGRHKHTGAEMSVVVSSRDPDFRMWFFNALVDVAARNGITTPLEGFELMIHETGSGSNGVKVPTPSLGRNSAIDEKGLSPEKSVPVFGESNDEVGRFFNVTFSQVRADLSTAVANASGTPGALVGITVCGPGSMVQAVADAAAETQVRILKGLSEVAADVWFHQEAFTF